MASPDHLRRWLEATGRRWLVFDALDMVNALPWPEGVVSLIDTIDSYRDYRSAQVVSRSVPAEDPNEPNVTINIAKGDMLELDEVTACMQWLAQRGQDLDPSWDPRKALG